MIKDNITAAIAAAAKSVLLGESPEGPRSEGEKQFVALHQILLSEPPSDAKAEESEKAPDSTEEVKKADEPQDAEVPGQDNPVEDPSEVETPMTEATADESPCCEPISQDEITEVLSKNAPASDWIHDFVNSDDPRFAGKSKEERIKMALGAYYGAQNESVTEAVAPGADESLESEYKDAAKKSDSAAAALLKKKGILPGISSLRPGEIKLGIKNELNGKKTIYASDTDGKLIAISGTASAPKIRYVVN